MKLAAVVTILAVLGAFVLGETWLIQHKTDPSIHVQNPTPIVVQLQPALPVDPPAPAAKEQPVTEDPVEAGDVPTIGDRTVSIGRLPNGAVASIDVTTGEYDKTNHIATFLVIEELATPVSDPESGDKVTEVIQKVQVNCANHVINILNISGIDKDTVTMHVVEPTKWIPIPQVGKSKEMPFTSRIEQLACPAPELVKGEQEAKI